MIHQFYFWGFFCSGQGPEWLDSDNFKNTLSQSRLMMFHWAEDWSELITTSKTFHFIVRIWCLSFFFFIKIKEIFLQKLIQENIFLIENPMNESNQLVKNKCSNCLFFSCDSSRRDLWCRRGWCAESRGSIVKIFS